MTDRPAEPMDVFEERLARRLRDLSAPALRVVDPLAVAGEASGTRPGSTMWTPPVRAIGSWTMARLVATLLLLATLLVAAILLGSAGPPPPPAVRLGHLAFERSGRIYVADADGSDPVRLEVADAWSPRWYGSRLTYRAGRALMVLDGLDATPVRATGDVHLHPSQMGGQGHIVGTPDGQRFAVLSLDALEITEEGEVTQTFGPPAGFEAWDTSDIGHLSWAPDGTALLVGTCEIRATCIKGDSGTHETYLVPLDGRPMTRLSSRTEPVWGATFSPDGTRIAYDSCHISMADDMADDFGRCDARGDYPAVMRADGSGRTPLDEVGPSGGPGRGTAVAWSPDSTEVAYSFRIDGGPDHGLSVAHLLDETRSEHIADGTPLRWSPDGERILFTDSTGLSSIAADGTDLTRLVEGATDGDWEWIADGETDLFGTSPP